MDGIKQSVVDWGTNTFSRDSLAAISSGVSIVVGLSSSSPVVVVEPLADEFRLLIEPSSRSP